VLCLQLQRAWRRTGWGPDGLGRGARVRGARARRAGVLTTRIRRPLNLRLVSLLTFIVMIASPQSINAVDVCAPGLIPPADAAKICQQVCADARPSSQFNGQWNNDSPTCYWFWYGQYGVCGCNPVPCQCSGNGQQNYCDESITPGGPNTCSSNCNCTEGRRCVNGWCQGNPGLPCCSDCRPRYQTCMTFCNGVPIEQRGNCQSLCGYSLSSCSGACNECQN
jgi:hypothetical protein